MTLPSGIYRSKLHATLKPRGAQRERPEVDEPDTETCGEARQAANAAWAKLICKVCEVDPLLCPNCGAHMRVIALIEDRP